MTTKIYDIIIDEIKIGTTALEKSDAPMGVVFGNIKFNNILSGYNFFKLYCEKNNIEIISDYPDEKIIATGNILKLKVFDQNGVEIKGIGNNIEGMDSDEFQISILGIPYPFFEKEFAHHYKNYKNQFNNDNL